MKGSPVSGTSDLGRHLISREYRVSVEVRSRFEGTWCRGFILDEIDVRADGTEWFRVRRESDSSVVPSWFAADDVAVEGRSKTTKWLW